MGAFDEGARSQLMLFDYFREGQRAFEEGLQRKKRSALEQLAGDYYAGKVAPDRTADFYSQVARNGGDPRMYQEDQRSQQAAALRRVTQNARFLSSLTDTNSRSNAYAAMRAQLMKDGSALGLPQLPEAWSDDYLDEVRGIAQIEGGGQQGYRPMNVSPGGAVVDPRTGKEVYRNTNFAPQHPVYDSNRGGWATPPGSTLGGLAEPDPNPGNGYNAGGFTQVAPPKPNYEGERLRLAQEAAERARQAAADAAEARRRASFGTAPAGQRFRGDGTLEDIPGYAPKTANADASKGAAGAAGLMDDAYAYAASDTGVEAAVLRQMTPEQVRDLINGQRVTVDGKPYTRQTRWMTGPVTGRIPGAGMLANADLEAYRSSAAGKQARINNPTGPVTNADFEVGAKSVWGPDKPDEVNADLIFNALKRVPSRASAPAPATAPAPPQQRAREGDVVVNKQTGERLQLRNGQWRRIN